MSQPEGNCLSCGAAPFTTHGPNCIWINRGSDPQLLARKCKVETCPAERYPLTDFCPYHLGTTDAPKPNQHDSVNHPPHYSEVVPNVECIDVVKHFSFVRGNAIKYLWRAGAKGSTVEDLKKAIWYIQREIDDLEMPGM